MSEPFVQGGAAGETAATEHWRQAVGAITGDARRLINRVVEANRIYRGNRIADVIAATEVGAAVPGAAMSKEQAQVWAALIAALLAFVSTEITPGMTIEDGLYAMWPAPPPEPLPAP